MNIQWYPGHMTKAVRNMQNDLKLVDLVIELIDARAPISSRNPDIDKMAQGKARLIIINKADLADASVSESWLKYFENKGIKAVLLDSRKNSGMKPVNEAIAQLREAKAERDKKRGIVNRPMRAMIAGIPNVGKSTLINSLAGKASAKTGDKPGVTKGSQWIQLKNHVELLDTPGILWPKFEDEAVGIKLALLGSVNEQITDRQELAYEGIKLIQKLYPGIISEKYGCSESDNSYETLLAIGMARNLKKQGGEIDDLRAASIFLDDLRSGRLARISLEKPTEAVNA